MHPPLLQQCRRHSVFICPSVHAYVIVYWKFVNTISYKLREFYQIYNFGAVGHKGELIEFWSQRSRSQQDLIWSNKVYFLTCLRCTSTYFSETYHSYSLPGVHDTDGIFQLLELGNYFWLLLQLVLRLQRCPNLIIQWIEVGWIGATHH